MMTDDPHPIKIIKAAEGRDILPQRKAQVLKRVDDIQSEMGRLQKLLNELRADVLHLTTE